MSFEFSLAAVLRYRESVEQREYFALEKIQHEIAGVELRIRQVDNDCSAATLARVIELGHGIRAAQVQSAYEYQIALEQRRDALRSLLQELKKKWRQQLACYEVARRERETFEKLRQKQLDTYNYERVKREQAMIADVFLSRHRRAK